MVLSRQRSSTFRIYDDCVAELKYEDGEPRHDQVLSIKEGETVLVGRDQGCQYFLSDERVSKQHLRIYSVIFDPDKTSEIPAMVYCEDLESTNGTYVNDRLIGIFGRERFPYLLSDGDVIEIRPKWKFHFSQKRQPKEERETEISRDEVQEENLKFFASRFVVSDRILGSSQCKVFLAEETSTQHQLACKVVDIMASDTFNSPHTSTSGLQSNTLRQKRSKAIKEIEILAELSHPNVSNLRKAFVSDTTLYIFTDLAAGGDLFCYLDSRGGQLHDLDARVISRQIALGIEYIHSKGIAHRDIKPDNVLVTGVDFGCRVILTDFGHATHFSSRDRMMTKVGTPAYTAPEVDVAERSRIGYTAAADMWSLGITTMCMLTGGTVIPRGKMAQLSQVQIAEEFLHVEDSQVARRWRPINTIAYDFLRKLLVLEPEQRLNATEALNHAWFKQPTSEAKDIERAYHGVNRFWRPREFAADVIENLPHRKTQDQPESAVQRLHRKIPDVTSSVHFSLHRHLNPRAASKRGDVLAHLEETQSKFVISREDMRWKPSQKTIPPVLPMLRTSKVSTKEVNQVDSQDLFGTSIKQLALRPSKSDLGLDETMEAGSSALTQTEDSDCEDEPLTSNYFPATTRKRASDNESALSKRMRKETDPEVRKLYDKAAREVPRFCTAKVLRDTVASLKLGKEDTGLRQMTSQER